MNLIRDSEDQNHAQNSTETANGTLDNDKMPFGKTPEIRAQNDSANDANDANGIIRTLQPADTFNKEEAKK